VSPALHVRSGVKNAGGGACCLSARMLPRMGMSLQVAAPEAVAHGRLEPAGTRTVQKTLVPLPQQVPPAVVAVGLNYRAHGERRHRHRADDLPWWI